MQQPLPLTPDASLDVTWNWSRWLGADSIASYTVTGSLGLALSSITSARGRITAWVSPIGLPPDGTTLQATCEVTTSSTPPRVDSRTMNFVVTRL